MNANEADLFALFQFIIDDFLNSFSNRTHGDDNIFGIGGAIIIEGMMFAASNSGHFIHIMFYQIGHGIIKTIGGFTSLKENIGILC